jgi:hypothetical protein
MLQCPWEVVWASRSGRVHAEQQRQEKELANWMQQSSLASLIPYTVQKRYFGTKDFFISMPLNPCPQITSF